MTPVADPEDAAAVAAFLETHSERAFRALYRAHTPYLYALALRWIGVPVLGKHRPQEAEDLVQETWLRAAEGLARFRWESSLRTWLAGILINCCRERRRALHLEKSFDEAGEQGKEFEASADATSPRIAAVDLDSALAVLSDELRWVLVLFEIEGYSHEEIARALEIPVGTSKSRLHLGRRALARRLGATPRSGPGTQSGGSDGSRPT